MNRILTRIDPIAGFEIWNRAVPLGDADYYYAPAHLRREYNATRVPAPLPVTEPSGVDLSKLSGWEKFDLAAKFMAEHVLDPWDARWSVRCKMMDRLCRSIKSGEFYAYGFHVPRKPSDVPVRLPIDVFELRFINGWNSSLKGAALEFVSVRVIRASEAQEIERRFPPTAEAPVRRRQGRPSADTHIEHAIASLHKDGKLPNNKTRKANIELVRQRVRQENPTEHQTDRGLGDSKIRQSLLRDEDASNKLGSRRR